MAETWNKKERERKKQQNKKAKEEKKKERKEKAGEGRSFEDMLSYVDENGNLSSTPPDPRKKVPVNAADIPVSVPRREDPDPAELIRTGVITFFNQSKGYGFIKDSQSGESVFVHINALQEPVKEGSKVSFEIEMTHRGASAIQVKLA